MPTLKDLLNSLGYPIAAHDEAWSRPFNHVVTDSRQVQPGDLFVARRGEADDGHRFIPDALARGAAIILAERVPEGLAGVWSIDLVTAGVPAGPPPLEGPILIAVADSHGALEQAAAAWRRRFPVTVVGVTGSVGKTSTKELVAAVLRQRYRVLKSEKSLNTTTGMATTLFELRPEHQAAVLEMGMYALGEISHLCQMALPHIGVVTNVAPVHLSRLGSIERIAQAKAELPQALPVDGVAILNGDDPRVAAMASQTRARVMMYGMQPSHDVWASDVESHGLEGIRLRIHYGQETISLRVPMLGAHSAHTVLAATAVGLTLRLSWEEIAAGLSRIPEQIRLVVVPGVNGATILDDTYNASPMSTLAALNLLAEMEGRRIAVLGDMLELGSYEDEGHRIVGRRAADVAHILVAVGERGRIIGAEARQVGMAADAVHFAATNSEAIGILQGLLQAGDFVLIKGSRAMAMEEIVAALRAENGNGGA